MSRLIHSVCRTETEHTPLEKSSNTLELSTKNLA